MAYRNFLEEIADVCPSLVDDPSAELLYYVKAIGRWFTNAERLKTLTACQHELSDAARELLVSVLDEIESRKKAPSLSVTEWGDFARQCEVQLRSQSPHRPLTPEEEEHVRRGLEVIDRLTPGQREAVRQITLRADIPRD